MYRLFYNHEVTGDVLFLLLKPEVTPNKVITKKNAALLYHDADLVGVNFFHVSRIIRLYSHGMIATPGEELMEIVNSLLQENDLSPLPPTLDSGYRVLKVTKIEDHPLSEKEKIVTLEGEKTYETVTFLSPLKVGDMVVAAMPGCIERDGTLFSSHLDHNIPVEVHLSSPYCLRLGEEKEKPFFPEGYQPGEDFYLPKER